MIAEDFIEQISTINRKAESALSNGKAFSVSVRIEDKPAFDLTFIPSKVILKVKAPRSTK